MKKGRADEKKNPQKKTLIKGGGQITKKNPKKGGQAGRFEKGFFLDLVSGFFFCNLLVHCNDTLPGSFPELV